MRNFGSANLVAMIIGIISIGFGLYGALRGMEISQYSLSIFFGVCLFGTGYIYSKAGKKKL